MLNLLKEVKDLTQESIRIRSKIDIKEQIEMVVGAIRDAASDGITQRRFTYLLKDKVIDFLLLNGFVVETSPDETIVSWE